MNTPKTVVRHRKEPITSGPNAGQYRLEPEDETAAMRTADAMSDVRRGGEAGRRVRDNLAEEGWPEEEFDVAEYRRDIRRVHGEHADEYEQTPGDRKP
jgi:hypothetical protein